VILASAHALPGPDGANIATILPAKLTVRETRSLEIIRVVALPPDFSNSIQWFLWSAASDRILIASLDRIRVYSPTDLRFIATIMNPTSVAAKVTQVAFGATSNEVVVFADFGLKVTIYNLQTSKSVEIPSPKYYTPGTAAKGFSYRPHSAHLALLTRSGGKDILSIHANHTYEVTRSWTPDTIDAQGLAWSPDGRWLALWESAGQGHKVQIYTPDGHLYKSWNGPTTILEAEKDFAMGAGVKMVEWSANSDYLAVGDYSLRVSLLAVPSFSETLNLHHSSNIAPTDVMQV
jgi:WD40 repeat protein